MSEALRTIGVTVLGTALGWSATALTMYGRLDAVEVSLKRIELRLDAMSTTLLKGKP